MITDGEKWQYLAVKSLSRLLRRITSKNNAHYYCINDLHLFRKQNKTKSNESVCKNHQYCHIRKCQAHNKILKYNQHQKFMKISLFVYTDTESLLENYTHMITIQKNH